MNVHSLNFYIYLPLSKRTYEINNIEVKNNAGIYVPITEIADINEQEKRATRHSRMNGADAIAVIANEALKP